jgi:hypothetical protein
MHTWPPGTERRHGFVHIRLGQCTPEPRSKVYVRNIADPSQERSGRSRLSGRRRTEVQIVLHGTSLSLGSALTIIYSVSLEYKDGLLFVMLDSIASSRHPTELTHLLFILLYLNNRQRASSLFILFNHT